jgi:D-amino-acid oxidase
MVQTKRHISCIELLVGFFHRSSLLPVELISTGGGCILGGCLQKGSWESQPDPNLAIRIMKRCVDLCPELTKGQGIEKLSIIRHGVGLRPMREGGPRVEKEKFDNVWVVHNYGHGGYGYQSSYGTAELAAKLVEETLHEKARL